MKRDLRMIQSCCDMRGSCWLWRLGGDAKGRPVARIDGRSRYVRRVAHELHHNVTLQVGELIGAKCGQMRCVSPACAFVGTYKEIHAIVAAQGRYSTHKKQLAIKEGMARASAIPPAVIQQVRAMPTSQEARKATGLSKSYVNRIRRGVVRNTDFDRQGVGG